MTFTVIDKNTGHYPDCFEIALKEEWAKNLCYCDIEGFAVEEDGTLVLLDECGRVAYCPEDRFQIVTDGNTWGDKIRSMSDEELVKFFFHADEVVPWCDESRGHHKEANGCEKCMLDWLEEEAE